MTNINCDKAKTLVVVEWVKEGGWVRQGEVGRIKYNANL